MATNFEHDKSPGIVRNLASKWSELSIMGKLVATDLVTSSAAALLNGAVLIKDPNDTTSEVFLGTSTSVLAASLAIVGVRKFNQSRERLYSKRKNFVDYTYIERGTGETFTSPFSVSASGVRGEFLGAGNVIGGIEDIDGDIMPVLAIQDNTTRKGEVQLLGIDCFWTPIDEELADAFVDIGATSKIIPASAYLRYLNS